MTRTPTAKCQGCARPMWSKAGDPAPAKCRECRAGGVFRVPRGLGLSRVEAAARARAARDAKPPRSVVCQSCPSAFVTTAPRRHYCDECQRARLQDRSRRKNRSRLGYQAAIRAFPINELGDRDRWTCHLCKTGVDPRLRDRHPGMASYDHVVPTSAGGSDEPNNLALAHLLCNVQRGVRLL